MLRRFLRDSAIYAVSAGLSRGLAILLVPLYTRFLHAAEYGALDVLMVVGTLANYVVALEISQGVARAYADAKDVRDRDQYVSTAWWFAAVTYALFLVLVFALSGPLSVAVLGSVEWRGAVIAMGLATAMNGMFFLMQDLMRWQLRPLRHTVASIVYSGVAALVGAGLVVFADAGVPGILYGQCAGAAAGVIVAWFGGATAHWKAVFEWGRWREMVSYSGPQVLSSMAGYLSLYLDRLLIKELMSLADVGTYGVAARIASIVALLMMGFHSGLVPLVFQHYRSPETAAHLARALRYFLVIVGALLLLLCAFSRELVWLFATPPYYAAWSVIPLLAATLVLSNMYIFVPGIFLARRTGVVALINVAAVSVNVTANVMLIPRFGLVGAGVAGVLSSALALACYASCNQRYYPVVFDTRRLAAAAAAIVIAGGALLALQTTVAPGGALSSRIALYVAACVICAWILLERAELALVTRRLLKNRPS